MENKENPFDSEFFKQEQAQAPELQKPMRKRKAPLAVGATFAIIGAVIFAIYVVYMVINIQYLTSGDATGLIAILLLPLAILIGLASCVLNLVGLINSIFAIRSDIPRVKMWGIILTVITALLIIAAILVFLLLLVI